MGLDIRLPIGGMFLCIGALLVLFGLMTAGNADLYKFSLGTNINLWWGLVMMLFGAVMTWLGWHAGAAQAPEVSRDEGGPAPGSRPSGH